MTPLVALLDDVDVGGGFGGGEVVDGGKGERDEGAHGRAACSRSTGTDTDRRRRIDPETGPPTTARSTSTPRRPTCKQFINNPYFQLNNGDNLNILTIKKVQFPLHIFIRFQILHIDITVD